MKSYSYFLIFCLILFACKNQGQPTEVVIAQTATPIPVEPSKTPTNTPSAEPTFTSTPLPTSTPTQTITPSPTPSPTVTATVDPNLAIMAFISGGFFEMGLDSDLLLDECREFRSGCQRSWFTASEPSHTLLISPYYIDLYEVSNESFIDFLNDLGNHEGTCLGQNCLNLEDSRIEYSNESYIVSVSLNNYPITGVSWYGASAFCEWRGGRLPSEAEWEMAARWNHETRVGTMYPWGDEFDGTLSNFCDVNCEETQANDDFDDQYIFVAPSGQYEDGRSLYGVYDMAGNLWEWVADWFMDGYYSESPTVDPQGPPDGSDRIVRGGSWFDTGNFTSSVVRFPAPPEATDATIGFRCAMDAP